ncbi:MAG TPA: hypothetical protein VFT53_00150 [Candidatus Saccharimonadales bacterium]|nr:hypothetical protein [Candidatus Saccharimonadales bacterium]
MVEKQGNVGLRAAERATDLIDMAACVGSFLVKDASPEGLQSALAIGEALMQSAVEEGGQIMDAAVKKAPGSY